MSSSVRKTENPNTSKRQPDNRLLPVMACALAIPLSMSMWLFNVGYSYFKQRDLYDDYLVIHPSRWLVASLSCFTVIVYGLKRKSLTYSGAFLGFFVGMILTIGSYCFLACLLVFFLTSSKATKFREHQKAKLEEDHKEGGQRSWVHVLCNGGMATQLSFLYLLDAGCGERPINFSWDYRPSWLAMGVLGSFACCNGDTWASELGTVLARGDPWLITNWKRVPRGTNGGVSIEGIILSAVGGLMVGSAHYLTAVYMADRATLANSPAQWPILLVGLFAGLIGSLIDSVLGATLQFSGIDMNGHFVTSPGKGVKHISGRRILDNHGVNLISSVIMGFIMPYVAMAIWPY